MHKLFIVCNCQIILLHAYLISNLPIYHLKKIWIIFNLLDIINNATMKIHIKYFVGIYVFIFWQYIWVKLLGHVTLCLNVWETAKVFSKITASFGSPTSSASELHFSTSLSTFTIIYLIITNLLLSIFVFNCKYPSECKVVSHFGFNLYFHDDKWCCISFFAYWPFL